MLRIMAGTDQRDSYAVGWFTGIAPRAVFLLVVYRPKMLVIMAGMDQKERYVAPCRKLRIFRSCSSSHVVDFPVVVQRPIPVVLTIQQTIVIPQLLLYMVVDAPRLQVVQISLSWRRGLSSSSDHRDSPVAR